MTCAAGAADPATSLDSFPVVLGTPRLLDADLLVLRDGTRRTGVIHQAEIRLHAAQGEIVFPTAALAALDLADDRNGLCSTITVTGDRLTGFLSPPSLEFRTADRGATQAVRLDRVLIALLKFRPTETTNRPGDCLVRLRNGDFFRARLANGRFVGTSDAKPLEWDAGTIGSVFFPEAGTNETRVVLGEGTVISARPAVDEFQFTLAGGTELAVVPRRLDALDRTVAEGLPPELRARIGAPSPADRVRAGEAAPPDQRVVPVAGMVWISAGEFTMGSPPEEFERDLDEGPLTRVVFTTGFWIGRHEVTQQEYQQRMKQNPSQYQYEGETLHPVERVSWLDAVDYCRRLTEQERAAGRLPDEYSYRLPTEAEWEYACRAGTSTRFSFGDDDGYALAREFAWFSRNSDSTTHAVGTKKPNAWGLHDMHGNVLEWCLDAWRGALPGGAVTNVAVAPEGTLRAVRGGSWLYDARYARSANRDSYGASVRCSDLGFRLVLAREAP